MNALTIQNSGNEMLIRFNKDTFDKGYLMNLVKKLELEAKIHISKVSPKIMEIANEIDEKWWEENQSTFLKDVKTK